MNKMHILFAQKDRCYGIIEYHSIFITQLSQQTFPNKACINEA